MNSARIGVRILILAALSATFCAAPEDASAPPLCPKEPPCGDDCSNHPFEPTTCWPTRFGPVGADIVRGPENLLYCSGGTYALCFFSGPEKPTGVNPDNKSLPCVFNQETGIADCTCQAYTSGAYFVLIGGILNEGAYFETVNLCGPDGRKCQNIANCGKDGGRPGCSDYPQAPVCAYVNQQNPDQPAASLIPGADLISTFSFAMSDNGDYQLNSTDCNGLYAGCMTAPCNNPNGSKEDLTDGDPVQCACPTYSGPFQVGQKREQGNPFLCEPVSGQGEKLVWSASYTVTETVLEELKSLGQQE